MISDIYYFSPSAKYCADSVRMSACLFGRVSWKPTSPQLREIFCTWYVGPEPWFGPSWRHCNDKATVGYTSPAMCTPVTPIPFWATAAATEWSFVLHDVIDGRLIPFAGSALQCIVYGEENPGDRRCGLSSMCRRRTEPRP